LPPLVRLAVAEQIDEDFPDHPTGVLLGSESLVDRPSHAADGTDVREYRPHSER
jgi:hypothetical protein